MLTLNTPNTKQVRNAMAATTLPNGNPVSVAQSYTDKRAGGLRRVSFLTYRLNADEVQEVTDKANAILVARGFTPIIETKKTMVKYGPHTRSYMRIVATCELG